MQTIAKPNDVAEINMAEAAYRRGDLVEKRRALMEAWAAYCDGAEVIDFPRCGRRSSGPTERPVKPAP